MPGDEMKLKMVPTRKCGECQECCIALEVVELRKPTFTPCANQGSGMKGCKVYDQRPAECEVFRCLWLQGFGSNSMRPDQTGLVSTVEETSFGVTYLVMETRAGSAKRGRTLTDLVLDAKKKGKTVVVGTKTSRTVVYVPEDKEADLAAMLKKAQP